MVAIKKQIRRDLKSFTKSFNVVFVEFSFTTQNFRNDAL